MVFGMVYEKWLAGHLNTRTGESKRRLIEGHSHAEKLFLENIWYPAFQQFEHLHPEYEVVDFRDGTRFLDFAYLRYPLRLAIEIDGYRTHAAGVSRWQFSDSLTRQNHLVLDGWTILRFSYDDVKEKPNTCIQMLQQFLGSRLTQQGAESSAVDILETEVIRLALRLGRPLKPIDVRNYLQIGRGRAVKILQAMAASKRLLPYSKGEQRIYCYIINREKLNERSL